MVMWALITRPFLDIVLNVNRLHFFGLKIQNPALPLAYNSNCVKNLKMEYSHCFVFVSAPSRIYQDYISPTETVLVIEDMQLYDIDLYTCSSGPKKNRFLPIIHGELLGLVNRPCIE